MPSRLKMEAAHFRVTGMAQLQIGINTCPQQGHEPLSGGNLGAMARHLGRQMSESERLLKWKDPKADVREAPGSDRSVRKPQASGTALPWPAARPVLFTCVVSYLLFSFISKRNQFHNHLYLLKGKLVRGDWFCWPVRCLPSPIWSPPLLCPLTSDLCKLPSSFLFTNINTKKA